MGNSKNTKGKKHKVAGNLLPVVTPSKRGINEGRKPAITPTVLLKLREAFLLGCDDEEACTFAGIAPATLYNHQKGNQVFLEWKEGLKRNPFIRARRTIISMLDYDADFALKYMERKKKGEFAPQARLTIDDTRTPLDDETKAAIGATLSEHLTKLKEKRNGNGDSATRSIPDAN